MFFPELDIRIPFSPGMDALLRAKITDSAVRRDAMHFSRRYAGDEAVTAKLVDAAIPGDTTAVRAAALELARKMLPKSDKSSTLAVIKATTFVEALSLLGKERESQAMNAIQAKAKL